MGYARDESTYVLLFVQLQVQFFGLIEKLNVDVRLVLFNLLVDAIEGSEVVGGHRFAQAVLGINDRSEAVITATDWALLNISIFVFENPGSRRAQLAVEVATVLAEELDVTEIKLGVIAFGSRAVSRADATLDQTTRFLVSGQVQGRVCPCILQVKIHAELHEALQDLDLRVSCGLMNAVVSMHILHQRIQLLLHQQPDDFDMAVVAGPVHGSVSSGLGRVRQGFENVSLIFVIIAVAVIRGLLVLLVLQVRLILDQHSNYVFISVTGRPKKRVPTAFLSVYIGTQCDRLLGRFEIVFLNGGQQHGIFLLRGQLLCLILGIGHVVVITGNCSLGVFLCINHLACFCSTFIYRKSILFK